jgi:hypothetical protein
MVGMNTTTVEAPRLTAHDRCDRCGAQAYVKFVLAAGGELMFCAHHARAHADALRPQSTEVIDETDRLDAKPELVES